MVNTIPISTPYSYLQTPALCHEVGMDPVPFGKLTLLFEGQSVVSLLYRKEGQAFTGCDTR